METRKADEKFLSKIESGESLSYTKPKVKLEEIRKTADEINYRLRIAKI